MATSSIFRDIFIHNKHISKNLLHALEKARKTNSKEHILSKPCTEVKGEDIKKVLENS